MIFNRWSLAALVVLLYFSACAPAPRMARAPEPVAALPEVPEVEGPLQIDVQYPHPGAPKPAADSTFLFGTVGTGEARLWINGLRVPVAPNGAFLAYVPVPEDGTYTLRARADRMLYEHTFSYRRPPPTPAVAVEAAGPAPAPEAVGFAVPLLGTVKGGKDTLATGSEIIHAAPTPEGDRRWFFPRGARLVVTGQQSGYYRIQLGDGLEAWVDTSGVQLGEPAVNPPEPLGRIGVVPAERYVDLRFPAAFAPFLIQPQEQSVEITIYGRRPPLERLDLGEGRFIEGVDWDRTAAETARAELALNQPLWGFKAFYDEAGTLVVRLRRPPRIDPEEPLNGIRVMVDPGHPPGGAVGPAGFTEADANLAISLRLAEMLRARGAEVILTRTSPAPLVSATSVATELWARVDLAVAEDADLLVSVHNNAFPDGVNPFENYGTETYYYWPFSRPLAEALLEEIIDVTGIPNLGAKQRSLALVRPAWMPSTLTESLFMMFPQQEVALRTPAFIERLAAAHLEGIVAFLQAHAAAVGTE